MKAKIKQIAFLAGMFIYLLAGFGSFPVFADDIIRGDLGNGFTWRYYGNDLSIDGIGEMPELDMARFRAGGYWAPYQDKINDLFVSDGITTVSASVMHSGGRNIDTDRTGVFDYVYLGKDVTLTDTLDTSVWYGYRVSNNNPNIWSLNGMLFSDMTLCAVPYGLTEMPTLSSAYEIGSGAFANSHIQKIVIPWGVSSIPEDAFVGADCGDREYTLNLYQGGTLTLKGTIVVLPDTLLSCGTQHGDFTVIYSNTNMVAAEALQNLHPDTALCTEAVCHSFYGKNMPLWNTQAAKERELGYKNWHTINGRTYYNDWSTEGYVTGFFLIGSSYYYFDPDNASMQTGFHYIDGKAYYFFDWGGRAENRWIYVAGSNYYLGAYGSGVVNCWQAGKDGLPRYLKADGKMAANEWVEDYGKKYFVDQNGIKCTGIKVLDGVTYYFDNNGVLQIQTTISGQDGLIYQDGKAYYYENGVMQRSKWVKVDGNWYYLNDNGAAVVNCWRLNGEKYYYLRADGKMKTNCWIQDYGSWYYVKADGSRYESSWAKINGAWYWFGGSGKMAESQWLKLADGKWYYFNESGAMAANQWVKSGAYWYYLGKDGAMLTNTTTPDGYRVDSQGRWI